MKYFFNLLLVILFLFVGCSSSKECMEKEIKGVSSVVGNEPFTKQAIITDENKIFIINAPAEIQKLLLDNQGHYFNIKYNSEKDSAGIRIIEVTKASKL